MSETIETKAKEAVESVLSEGQSTSIEGMSVSKASLRDAHAILTHEESRTAVKRGRRPLFRGINIGGAF